MGRRWRRLEQGALGDGGEQPLRQSRKPRLHLQAAEDDVFLGDTTHLAQAAESAGVATTVRVFPRLWHVFQLSAGALPEADRALREVVQAMV